MKKNNRISLTTIPDDFFDDMTNVTKLSDCFNQCTSLYDWLLVQRRMKIEKIYEKIKSHRENHQ